MKKTIIIVIILLLTNVYAYGSTGYTNISNIALYNNNNLGSEVKDTLKMNSKVEILDNKDEWYKVKAENGKPDGLKNTSLLFLPKNML